MTLKRYQAIAERLSRRARALECKRGVPTDAGERERIARGYKRAVMGIRRCFHAVNLNGGTK